MNTPDEEASAEAASKPGTTLARLLLYVLPILLLPLILIGLAFFIVPTQWFLLHSGNTYMANFAYGETLVHSDCKIVIYGDSSALVGVDPLILQQKTGLKACNIAEFEGMTAVNGTVPLDHYLSHNPPPRYIVFLYAPDNLRIPPQWSKVSSFEAVTYRVRHGHDLATAWLLMQHPADTLGWAEQGMRMSLLRIHSPVLRPDQFHVRDPYNGQLRAEGVTLKTCDVSVKHDDAPDLQWVAHLRSYDTAATTVILDATPSPPCDSSLPYFQPILPKLVDDIPYPIYPVDMFVESQKLHVNARGSVLLSNMIAAQISQRMETRTTAEAGAPGITQGRP